MLREIFCVYNEELDQTNKMKKIQIQIQNVKTKKCKHHFLHSPTITDW